MGAGRGTLSLKLRLTAGAVLLTAATVLTALTLLIGMARVGARMEAALAAEARMARYSTLSTQVSTFLVVATEAVQRGMPVATRSGRLDPVADSIRATFALINSDLEHAVQQAQALGLDRQSRHATQSLALARMAASVEQTLRGLAREGQDIAVQRAYIDSFASTIDPLLNEAVNAESLFRRETLAGIAQLRQGFTVAAVGVAALSILLAMGFYIGLIRPQFRRLDLLRDAARQFGQEDFSIALPDGHRDEIGTLFVETNQAARALAERQAEVQARWAQLNDEIALRTQELRTANTRLEAVDESRRRLFADISHELRTPLTVILMEAQLGRQTLPDAAEVFQTIESRAARLNRRIDDLLRVARSDSGALALSPAALSLGTLIAEVAEEVSAECAAAGMSLTTQAASGRVMADPNWLRQVLVGVVRNAIRHAREGGLVHISGQVMGDTAELAVTDNGPGIPAEVQPLIFDRFAQGEPNRAGFGLGLALAKWVMTEHSGTIDVQSPVSDPLGAAPGTKVRIRLPVITG